MKISKEQRNEIVEMARDHSNSYEQIAQAYGVSSHYVSTLALHNGINRNVRKLKLFKCTASIDDEIAAARLKLDALLEKKASLEIRFEWVDPTTVTVFGVTDKFIILEGVAKFREFVTKRMK